MGSSMQSFPPLTAKFLHCVDETKTFSAEFANTVSLSEKKSIEGVVCASCLVCICFQLLKGKGMFLYSTVFSPWDCSKHFTLHPLAVLFLYTSSLAVLFTPAPSQLLLETFSHAAVTARRIFVQLSTCL